MPPGTRACSGDALTDSLPISSVIVSVMVCKKIKYFCIRGD